MSKTLITIIIIAISVIAFGLYINKDIFNPSPALKLSISTNLSTANTPRISNISFEQTTVPFFYKKGDTKVEFPDINAFIKSNEAQSEQISFWASQVRKNDEDDYTLTLVFRDGEEPKTDDLLLIRLSLTDIKGRVIYKTTAFYGWMDN